MRCLPIPYYIINRGWRLWDLTLESLSHSKFLKKKKKNLKTIVISQSWPCPLLSFLIWSGILACRIRNLRGCLPIELKKKSHIIYLKFQFNFNIFIFYITSIKYCYNFKPFSFSKQVANSPLVRVRLLVKLGNLIPSKSYLKQES
jgi:hypothetical protein